MNASDSNDNDITRTHIALTRDSLVGHYRIVDKIGAGGTGEVRAAAKQDDPYITTIHEIGEYNGQSYFAHLVGVKPKTHALGTASGTARFD